MELQHYISNTVCSIMKGLDEADKQLRKDELGQIWKKDFDTQGSSLVGIRIAKGTTKVPGISRPVLILEYDVNVVVREEKSSKSSAEVGVGSKFLQILPFTGKVEGGSAKSAEHRQVQNLKFSVPVAFSDDKAQSE